MLQNISKRYQIQRELGSGGMGTVYLGLDKQNEQPVAIKALKKELTQPEMLERFQREGQALRELNHPNIVKLVDTLEAEGQHYLVMEYVAGGDLRQLLQNGKLPNQRCLNIAIDLADALTRAHRLNIIHRDLKPANVLLAQDGTIRLTDFGVAHVVDKERVTETDAIVGTLDYLPPEVLNGEAVEPRSDIWAFGVMLFEMLAGQRPFNGTGYIQTLQAIATAPIPDLEALAPDAPTALVDLVYRMLNRDPQARISSVRYVGAELEEILQGGHNRPVTKRFETPIPDFRLRPKHNLPALANPFVGREAELVEVARLLRNSQIRLVSIIAQGGMGKTRLALESAAHHIDHFEHGVFFVELAPLSESSNIIPAIANTLGYHFQNDGREPKQQILDFLQTKDMLLVLDNFEHLLDAAGLVTDLLNAAPKLKILVTSRQRLDQTGESLFHLSGMDFPAWETPDDAMNYGSMKLFMNSAMRAKPDFELRADNLDAVARICKLVQGMPLGIVLAAAWLGMLSPEEIASELQKGLDFLETDSQQIPERQRSMRAVMDYSWRQMSEAEQAVFAKLSVFRGGFTREAAESVARANLRILMSLVNKSLLRRNNTTGRYEIHELLRQYAEEQLRASQARDRTESHYANYFLNFVASRLKLLQTFRQIEMMKLIEQDWLNIIHAASFPDIWQSSAESIVHDFITALKVCHQDLHPRHNENEQLIRLLANFHQQGIINSTQRNYRLFFVYFGWHETQRIEFLETVSYEAELNKDLTLQAAANFEMAMYYTWDAHQPEESLKYLRRAYENYQELQDPYWIARCESELGERLWQDREQWLFFCQSALKRFEEMGNRAQVALNLIYRFGHTYGYVFGEMANADIYAERALKIAEELALPIMIVEARGLLGWLAMEKSDYVRAREHAEAGIAADSIIQSGIAHSYIQLANLKIMVDKDYQAALELAQAAYDYARNHSVFKALAENAIGQAYLGLADYEKAIHHSIPWLRIASGIRPIYSIHLIALAYARVGRYKEAVEWLSLSSKYSLQLQDWALVTEILGELEVILGTDAFQAAWEHGKKLDMAAVQAQILAEHDK